MENDSTSVPSTHAPVKFLIGERLYLRPIEESDLTRCQRWINNPEVRQFIATQFPVDEIGERDWHTKRNRSVPPSSMTFAIILNDGDEHIGNMGLERIDWHNRSAITGTLIGDPQHRGKGYGSAAKMLLLGYCFDTLGLERVATKVLATNERSLRCQLKCGYKEEGRLRRTHFVAGRWCDTVILSILADEWRALKVVPPACTV
jgi:RimJ/RimL family protein N-acetyltransferase